MELPIQVMIVLFVAIIAASSVIIFSTDIIREAKTKINEPWNKENTEDKILDVETITDGTINIAIEECYKLYKQEALSKTLCFILHGQENEASVPPATVNDITVESDNFDASRTSLYVYYEPSGDKIKIEI